jgi:lysophospholipase L1-like esterase
LGANGLKNSRLNAASLARQGLQRMSRWIKQRSQLMNTEAMNQLEIGIYATN